jgi:hypothetical protein
MKLTFWHISHHKGIIPMSYEMQSRSLEDKSQSYVVKVESEEPQIIKDFE